MKKVVTKESTENPVPKILISSYLSADNQVLGLNPNTMTYGVETPFTKENLPEGVKAISVCTLEPFRNISINDIVNFEGSPVNISHFEENNEGTICAILTNNTIVQLKTLEELEFFRPLGVDSKGNPFYAFSTLYGVVNENLQLLPEPVSGDIENFQFKKGVSYFTNLADTSVFIAENSVNVNIRKIAAVLRREMSATVENVLTKLVKGE